MTYTFDENLVSDLHKAARGYRPTSSFWNAWNFQCDEGKQTAWNVLLGELEETMNREKLAYEARANREKLAYEARALAKLLDRILDTMKLGADDRKTAIKWIIQAEEFDDFDLRYGASYFCFHFGLSYQVMNELPIQEAINEMLSEVV